MTIQYLFILRAILIATIFSFPFSGIRFFIGSVPIYMPELMIIIVSAMFLYLFCHTDTFKIQKLPKAIFIAITLLWSGILLSSFYSSITFTSLGIIKSWFFFPMLFSWLLFQTLSHTENAAKQSPEKTLLSIHTVLYAWYASLLLVSIAALAYAMTGNFTYDHRLKAFYLSPNYLALFLAPGILIGWHTITVAYHSKKPLLFVGAILAWCFIGVTIYLTLSYTVILASLLSFFLVRFFQSLHNRTFRITPILIGIACIAFFLFTQRNDQKFSDLIHMNERSSFASRLMIWQASTRMIKHHPLIGIGPGNFQSTYLQYQSYFPPYLEWAVPHPHNLYLALWLQTSIVGLIGFLFLIYALVSLCFTSLVSHTKKTPLVWVFLNILLAWLLIGITDTPLFKSDLSYEFWLVASLILTLHKKTLQSNTVELSISTIDKKKRCLQSINRQK